MLLVKASSRLAFRSSFVEPSNKLGIETPSLFKYSSKISSVKTNLGSLLIILSICSKALLNFPRSFNDGLEEFNYQQATLLIWVRVRTLFHPVNQDQD